MGSIVLENKLDKSYFDTTIFNFLKLIEIEK